MHAAPYLFEAAHEVVADRGAWQVRGAGAPAHVEEVIWAQHGVVFLGIACGGEDAIHGDGHLLKGRNTQPKHSHYSASPHHESRFKHTSFFGLHSESGGRSFILGGLRQRLVGWRFLGCWLLNLPVPQSDLFWLVFIFDQTAFFFLFVNG